MNEGEIVPLPVGEIGPGPKVRDDRLDLDHVARLRPVVDLVPPVVVRETGKGWTLIDGAHRLAAHKDEQRETIRAVVVAMDDAEALEAAIEANIAHGLTLTTAERKRAAKLLVETTKYGDARIAQICGLGAGTVKDLRPKCSGVDLNTRTGTDGKDYPTPGVAAAHRRRAVEAYSDNPSLTVRALAKLAGCSVGTAQAVIAEFHKNEPEGTPAAPPAPPAAPAAAVSPAGAGMRDDPEVEQALPARSLGVVPPPSDDVSVGEVVEHYPPAGQWKHAEGAKSTNAARDFARFMDGHTIRVGDRAVEVAAACPAPLRQEAVTCARMQVQFWTEFAAALEHPARLTSVEEA